MEGMKLLRLWCCFFVFYISNLLSYIQNNFSYELARPIMGTIFLVYIYIYDSRLNRPESVSLTSLARQIIYSMRNFVLITRKEGGT